MKRKYIGLAAAAAASVAYLVVSTTFDRRAEPSPGRTIPVVDESAPEHKLLEDALQIDVDRQFGEAQPYLLVPKNRPPDLLRIGPGSHSRTDGIEAELASYQFGKQWLNVAVELAARPTKTCQYIRDDLRPTMCVRNNALPETAPGTPRLRFMTVYLTGNVNTEPKTGDPETERARKFWSETEMVPLDEAAWFTDLLSRGRAAQKQ